MTITSVCIKNLPQTMFGPMPEVIASMQDGSEVSLFEYYSDELTFHPSEFIGLTIQEGRDLKRKKDIRYLQS